ncbi:MAG: heme o synthase [Chloroflexi bacterium]|nr:heme o synthase [Chloroflexota bacterium]
MSRFHRLALTSVVATYVMILIGVIVRSTGSGMGCPDWPLCHGQIIPPMGDSAAWLESIHRWWGVLIGFLVLGLVISAFRTQRATRSLVVGSIAALVMVGFQAYLGKVTVEMTNSAESVTAHLSAAMLLLAIFLFLTVRSRYPAVLPWQSGSQRITLLVAFSAIAVFALLLFGTEITCVGVGRTDGCAALIYPDWPLFDGAVVPTFDDNATIAGLQMAHVAHRVVAAIVGIILAVTTLVVWRAARSPRRSVPGAATMLGLIGTAATLFAIQVIVGALQIWTKLAPWAVSLHLALGAAIWGLLVTAALVGWYATRVEATMTEAPDTGAPDVHQNAGPPATRRDRVAAYIALTKPRIIELLLVTTLPAMILAWTTVDGLNPAHFAWLAFWTLIGGTLGAGAANAINCYLDRDIDEIMVRTRRRPMPAHQVAPVDGLMFGLVLTVVSFGILALTTNLVAAFLTLLAVGFYVVVYTMLLKRTTPQNIVLGGAAGALPPVIGWAAVTGDITLPALLLFAIVFYWTPPHFWALSLRIRGDYAAADVPMMPVVHGVPETTRQIALYSVLMVALTLVFFAVAHMGLVFLAGVMVLGALFLFQAFAMWREGTDRRAVKLYKYSITYLSGVFALIVLDVAIFLPLS